jgi:hypothetical protein
MKEKIPLEVCLPDPDYFFFLAEAFLAFLGSAFLAGLAAATG